MSHSHSHAPGQPSHSHGPSPPQTQPGTPQQQPQKMPPPDPVMQAMIEATFQPIDVALQAPENIHAICPKHSLEKCADCGVDFINLNRMSKLLHMNPHLRCPPPPQMVQQKLSQAVASMKEEGNNMYKAGQHGNAVQRYTMAANIAIQRPPWELQGLMREELSTCLSNRSAAYFEAGDYLSALVDSEVVIQLRKPWSKGYFRKAKALMKMGQLIDAKEAIEAGLAHEPDNSEMLTLLGTVEQQIKERQSSTKNEKSNGVEAEVSA